LQAVKDVPAPQRAMFERALVPSGYRDIPGLPVAHLEIGFPTMDAYLQSMTPGTRKDMRRKLKSLTGIRVERRTNIDDVMDRVMKLYGDTRARAEMQFETLTPAYFSGVLSGMAERSMCTLFFAGEELLALNLLLADKTTLLDKFFCMDGAAGRDHNLYFLSWFQNVQYCLDHGLTRYQSGQAAYANKLRLGSKLTKTAMYFRHRNPVINGALKLVAPIFAKDPTAHLARARDAEAA
jgi:predicted N-acyltransferase